MELHRPGALSDPKGLRLDRRVREQHGAVGNPEAVGVSEERLEAWRQHAQDRIAQALVGQPDLVEARLLPAEQGDRAAERMGERLRAEADPEERRLARDPVA